MGEITCSHYIATGYVMMIVMGIYFIVTKKHERLFIYGIVMIIVSFIIFVFCVLASVCPRKVTPRDVTEEKEQEIQSSVV